MRLAEGYGSLIGAAMAHRKLVLALGAIFVVASASLFGFVGLDFFPSVDAGLLRFHLRAPSGSRIEQTERIVDAVEQDVRRTVGPDQVDVIDDNLGVPLFYNLGYVNTENASEADAEVTVGLKPEHSPIVPMMDRIRRRIREDFPGSTLYFEQADVVGQVLNFGLPAPIDVQVQAREYKDALPFALRLERDIEGIPGATDTRLGQVLDHPSFQVDVDRERAIQLGLHEQDVASSLLTSLSSSTLFAPNFWVNPQNDVNYNVIVQAPYFHVSDVPSLMATPITGAAELQAQTGRDGVRAIGRLAAADGLADRAVSREHRGHPPDCDARLDPSRERSADARRRVQRAGSRPRGRLVGRRGGRAAPGEAAARRAGERGRPVRRR